MGASESRVRIGRSFAVLCGLGLALEVAASAVCHLISRSTPADEMLSFAAMTCFVWASLIFVYRNVRNPRVTACMLGASLLLLAAGVLDVTGSVKWFDHSRFFGHPSDFHKILHDVSFAAGIVFVLIGFTLSALQAYQAQWRLERQNEELRRETNARVKLASAIEQSAESIMITDPEGVIEYVNPAFVALSGYSREEIVGQKTTLLEGGARDARHYNDVWEAISRGETWRGHFINKRKDGTEYEVSSVISCVRDSSGAIVNYIAAQHDVTAQMNLEKQLRQAQKMEVLGAFAGHIAHDFNNILALILGHSEMALRQLPDQDPVQAHVRHIEKAGHRASKLIRQMLTFSRQAEQERRPVAVHLIVKEVLDFLRASLPPTVTLLESVQDCGMVMADATQIHQVVMNLCTNAYQALKGGVGTMEVVLEVAEVGAGFMPDAGQIASGQHVRLRVRDTGTGIDAATLPHIFDPFFSTKRPGEGTGLGLSTVHGIVSGYGGAISVTSEAGCGATFDVYLPRLDGVFCAAEPEREPLAAGVERILLVDDNEEIVEMTRMSLEDVGYSVAAFSSSVAALEAFRRGPQEYDLVITDQVMPDMTGAELSRSMLGLRPDIPIIMVTGFGQGITSEQARAMGIAEYLQKPFSDQELNQAIRRVLAGADRPQAAGLTALI